ncbi:hypothetical protein SUSUWATARI_00160 [Serratia phage vB_SmaM-Susuwatari]|nr:hypothetical protein SUSUWATARI_00160 [Serratia phage vB_SmaM-Susuwatari]
MTKTPFDELMASFNNNPDAVRAELEANTVYPMMRAVRVLEKLQNHLSWAMLVDWFGEPLGHHLWDKFINGHGRNVLNFTNSLTAEYRLFILFKALETWR